MIDNPDITFVEIMPVADLGINDRIYLQINEEDIVLLNIAKRFYAVADICTHDDGPLGEGDLEAYSLICPRHGARFDVRDGSAQTLPAVEDIPVYPVKIENDLIYVGVPKLK